MEQKLITEMLGKIIAAESVAELMALIKEIGAELTEKDANALFEQLRTHAGEITEAALLKKFESITSKNQILKQQMDDDEMASVGGGLTMGIKRDTHSKASHSGGCNGLYYTKPCTDTVEEGSSCWSGDYCKGWDSAYYS